MKKAEVTDGEMVDEWISTTCGICYACCPIKVHVVNGIPVKIEGDPRSSISQGAVCGKGAGSMTVVTDPNRINKPLKRTNPEKGIGIDPEWQEITWDEALNTIASKLKEIYDEDPRQLKPNIMPAQGPYCQPPLWAFAHAFGSPNESAASGGMICGNAAHFVAGLTHGAWSHTCDFENCNYLIHFGASKGHAAGHGANQLMRGMADARARGMKQIAFDPVCNFVAGKATRWVPIIPGTDLMVVLAMLNVILNELQTWDDVFIKTKTNGPYLIGSDKLYIRDRQTNKPLVWDAKEGKAKTWDDPTVKDFALEGSYEVNGTKGTPAFQLLREHLKQYTPEMASEESSVPAATIYKIAEEFVKEARIGSTIAIKGKTFPFRPVAAVTFRGVNGHKNAFNSIAAIHILNMVVGAMDVPGGAVGWPTRCFGFEKTGRPCYEPSFDPVDGMLLAGWWWGEVGRGMRLRHTMWPIASPSFPENSLGLKNLYTWVNDSPFFFSSDREEIWKKMGLSYRFKAWMNWGTNLIMSGGNLDNISDTLKKIPFVFTFDIYLSEFTDFCDIVLPDTSFLESLSIDENLHVGYNGPIGMSDWSFHLRQPVTAISGERRSMPEVLLDLAGRIGPEYRKKYLHYLNLFWALEGKNALDEEKEYTWEQINDSICKNFFGDEHDLSWFKKNGGLEWPKKPEEAFWRYEISARVPLYWEFIIGMGEKVKEIAEPRGLNLDWRQFTPLPTYFACHPDDSKSAEYDLYAITYRDILHSGSATHQHPEIDRVSQMNPYSNFIIVNEDVGKEKGLKDGQLVWVESETGRRAKGRIKLMQSIHPRVIAFAATSGHWSKHMPIAFGKGVHFNDLLEIDKDHIDPVSLSVEASIRVKIHSAKED